MMALLLVKIVAADQRVMRGGFVCAHQRDGALRRDLELASAHTFAGFAFPERLAERLFHRMPRVIERRVHAERKADPHAHAVGKSADQAKPQDRDIRLREPEGLVSMMRELRAHAFGERLHLRRIALVPIRPRILAERHARQRVVIGRQSRAKKNAQRQHRARDEKSGARRSSRCAASAHLSRQAILMGSTRHSLGQLPGALT